MDFRLFRQDLKTAQNMQGILVMICVSLLIANILLIVFAMEQSKKVWTLVVPTVITAPFKVSQLHVDSQYLRQMSLVFLDERLNVSPETVSANHELLLSSIAPAHRAAIDEGLKAEATAIQSGKISSTFFLTSLKISKDTLSVIASGNLSTWVGERFISTEQRSYVIAYAYQGGRLVIQDFSEVSHGK